MQATVIIGISYVLFLGTLSEYAGSCYHLYLLCLLPQSYLKVFRLAVTIGISYVLFLGTLSKYSAAVTICISYVLFFRATSKYSDLLLPLVSLMSSSSQLSQSMQAAVTICISYVLFFGAFSKYPGNCYYLYLLCPLLQGSLKVCRMLWGKGSCYQLDPNTQDSKTKKKKAQNHSQQPGTSTTYHQSLQGPEHQWECSSTALCASVWRSQTPSSAESTTTTTKRSCI